MKTDRDGFVARLMELGIAYPVLVYQGMVRGLLAEALLLAAILKVGGVQDRKSGASSNWEGIAGACKCDPIFQLTLYRIGESDPTIFSRWGIHANWFDQARRCFREYKAAVEADGLEVKMSEEGYDVELLLEAVKLGFDQVFFGAEGQKHYQDSQGFQYSRDNHSPIKIEPGSWIVGELFTIPNGPTIIRYATEITQEEVFTRFRDQAQFRVIHDAKYVPYVDRVEAKGYWMLCGVRETLELVDQTVPDGYPAHVSFRSWLVNAMIGRSSQTSNPDDPIAEIIRYNQAQIRLIGECRIGELPASLKFLKMDDRIESWVKARIGEACSIKQIVDLEALRFPDVQQALDQQAAEYAEKHAGDDVLMRQAFEAGCGIPAKDILATGDDSLRSANRSSAADMSTGKPRSWTPGTIGERIQGRQRQTA